ncbi:MAG: hypothetical protein IJU10_00535, partial [Clostridia bacterium]|nr:hypothetical protein [Clostridia bacterium]
MQYHKKYEIEPSFVKDSMADWHATGNGEFIICTHKGTRYFVKRFTFGPRYPSKSLPEVVYNVYLEESQRLENKQKEIRDRFDSKKLTFDKDHIVIEEENFWDDDTNMFVTITQFVEDIYSGEFTSLSQTEFTDLARAMAELIFKAHDAGVTHGDLKEKNFFFQKRGSAITPYLIDFDLSYPSDYGQRTRKDGTPMFGESAPFSEGYESPEIYIYNETADMAAKDPKAITSSTDIYTLAVIFHRMWTGQSPIAIGSSDPLSKAIYDGKQPGIDGKFNFSIGPNNDNRFASLLLWMLSKEPSKRPTAEQVLAVMDDQLDVGDFCDFPGLTSKIDLEPHPIHKNAITILGKDDLKSKDVRSLQKVTRGGQYMYQVKLTDGTELILSVDDMVAKGYAIAKDSSIEDLWENDVAEGYEYLPAADISAKGVAKIERQRRLYR